MIDDEFARQQGAFEFSNQTRQYPKRGPAGISYFRADNSVAPGMFKEGQHIDALLYRNKKNGRILGILNHYPFDFPPYEIAGNVNVMVDPEYQKKGIGAQLLREAGKRWDVDLGKQGFSEAGAKLANKMIPAEKIHAAFMPVSDKYKNPNAQKTFQERLGNCYELAGMFAFKNPGTKLIHGTIEGRQFGMPPLAHAWVELPDGNFYEPASNEEYTPHEFDDKYHPRAFATYDHTQMATQMLKTKHWGPWDNKSNAWYESKGNLDDFKKDKGNRFVLDNDGVVRNTKASFMPAEEKALAEYFPEGPTVKRGETDEIIPGIFYSQVERTIQQKIPNRATPEQIMNTLKNTPGVKAEELSDLRISDFLKGKEGKPVDKDTLLAYVRQQQPVIREYGIPAKKKPVEDAEKEAERPETEEEVEARRKGYYITERNGKIIEGPFPDQDEADEVWREKYVYPIENSYIEDEAPYTEEVERGYIFDKDGEVVDEGPFDDEYDAQRHIDSLIRNYPNDEDYKGWTAGTLEPEWALKWPNRNSSGNETEYFPSEKEADRARDKAMEYVYENASQYAYDTVDERIREHTDIDEEDFADYEGTEPRRERSNEPPVKWPQYSIKGGSNYREAKFAMSPLAHGERSYKSHWSEREVAAHARYKDFNTDKGQRFRLVDEFQSDVHQQARDIRKGEVERLMDEEGKSKSEAEKMVPRDYGYTEKTAWQIPFATKDGGRADYQGRYPTEEEANRARAEMIKSDPLYSSDPEGWTVRKGAANELSLGQADEWSNFEVVDKDGNVVFAERARSRYGDDDDSLAASRAVLDDAKSSRDFVLNNSPRESKSEAIPDFPMKQNWTPMVFKRMLRQAVDDGAEMFGWSTGKHQVERYETALRQAVDNITWRRQDDGTIAISAFKGDENVLEATVPENGRGPITVDRGRRGYGDPERGSLEDIVGKGGAQTIRSTSQPKGKIEGSELTVGGEGMQGFYDNILRKWADDYIKKWGVKTERHIIKARDGNESVWGFPITDKMKQDVLAGQPLFMPEAGPREPAAPSRAKTQLETLPLRGGITAGQNAPDWTRRAMKLFSKEEAHIHDPTQPALTAREENEIDRMHARIEREFGSFEDFYRDMRRGGGASVGQQGQSQQQLTGMESLPRGVHFMPTAVQTHASPEFREKQQDSLNYLAKQQQASPEFKRWFGKSQITDNEGRPAIVYHQTITGNEEGIMESGFDTSKVGSRASDVMVPNGIFLKPSATWIPVSGYQAVQLPLYAKIEHPLVVKSREALVKWASGKDKDYATTVDEYQKLRAYVNSPEGDDWLNQEGIHHEAVNDYAEQKFGLPAREKLTEAVRKAGYDGVIIENDVGSRGISTKAIIALDPTQVKSAVHNTGAFDPDNPHIQFMPVVTGETAGSSGSGLRQLEVFPAAAAADEASSQQQGSRRGVEIGHSHTGKEEDEPMTDTHEKAVESALRQSDAEEEKEKKRKKHRSIFRRERDE